MKRTVPTRWAIFWAVLLGIVAGAYIFIAVTGAWGGSLTNVLLSLVYRWPWLGVPLIVFLVWLLLHFLVPVLGIWRDRFKRKGEGD